MKWTLKNIKKETDHPFLNYYTLTYDVEKEDGTHYDYQYYMVSRRKLEDLLPKTHNYRKPDAVMFPLYYIDEKGDISLLFTRQFRPAVGTYLMSFPAGLMDPGDKDIKETMIREAREEAGAEITDIEILSYPAPTSSGFSDEINALGLARIVSIGKQHLEEFEDISRKLVPLKEIPSMMNKPEEYYFPCNVKLFLLYLLERFKGKY